MIDTVALRGVAENNNGHCDRCGQSIKFYRYKVSGAMCRFLVAMAKHTKATGEKNIDITALGLTYSTHSQATKLRLHGLIARVKNERGVQIANHWLITRKGYQFLAGEPIPARVIVYNNQVLGHDDGTTTIRRVMGADVEIDAANITEAEAKTYNNVREPQIMQTVRAQYLGRYGRDLQYNEIYELQMERLQMGRPVKIVVNGQKLEYNDIHAFYKAWKVVSNA